MGSGHLNVRAFVMAAGMGTRLSPITDHLPKPLVPVANHPALEYLLARLPAAGVTEVAINLHHYGDAVQAAFGDGSRLGLRIRWSPEPELLGTAGGAGPVADFLRETGEPFLVLSGDGLHAIDLAALVRRHREAEAVGTLTVLEIDDPSRFGVCVLDDDDLITAFQEKPALADALSRSASCGVYCFEPRVLDRLPPGGFCDWARDVLPAMLADGDRLAAYRTEAYWSDIGTVAGWRGPSGGQTARAARRRPRSTRAPRSRARSRSPQVPAWAPVSASPARSPSGPGLASARDRRCETPSCCRTATSHPARSCSAGSSATSTRSPDARARARHVAARGVTRNWVIIGGCSTPSFR
jgi:dTDP-glucose pyrophosphorylase